LQQTALLGYAQATGIGGDEDIAGALRPLLFEPGQQLIVTGLDYVHSDARSLREAAEERLVGVVVPMGMAIHPAWRRARRFRRRFQGAAGE